MNLFKHLLLFVSFFAIVNVTHAQDFQVPENVIYLTAADYVPYEKDVIKCVNWLESTPVNKEMYKRKEAASFLSKWIDGSPNVIIELRGEILTFVEKNEELLTIFMGGWTKFVLENPEHQKDKVKGNVAGIRSVVKVYTLNKENGMKKDKNVEKYAQLDSKGELEAWVANQLKK